MDSHGWAGHLRDALVWCIHWLKTELLYRSSKYFFIAGMFSSVASKGSLAGRPGAQTMCDTYFLGRIQRFTEAG